MDNSAQAQIQASALQQLKSLPFNQAVRLTPATFAHYISEGRWIPAKHLLYIAQRIAQGLRRGNSHIIVSMPPRHGKSELLSIHTSSWWLDAHPEANIMLSTYGADLATDHARRVRDMILADAQAEQDSLLEAQSNNTSQSRGILSSADIALAQSLSNNSSSARKMRVTLRKDATQTSRFMTTEGGGMFAVGVGGALTGRGANLLLIDDYVKNAQEAESVSAQEAIWDWYASTAYSRLEPGASEVILATRWNVFDLIGRILTSDFANDYEYIRIPAISEGKDDPLGRPEGVALWPERYDEDALARIKRVQGTYFWNSLYQQDPRPRGETRIPIENIEVINADQLPHPSKLKFLRAWDTAATEDGGDYTAGALCAIDTQYSADLPTFYIIEFVHGQMSSSRVFDSMQSAAQLDSQSTHIAIEQEPGSAGKAMAEHIVNNILRGFEVKITRSTQDKFLRAQPFIAAVEDGRVKIVRTETASTFIEELRAFPKGPNDDLVDAVALAYNTLTGRRAGRVTWGRDKSPQSDGTPESLKRLSSGSTHTRKGNVITGITFGRRR